MIIKALICKFCACYPKMLVFWSTFQVISLVRYMVVIELAFIIFWHFYIFSAFQYFSNRSIQGNFISDLIDAFTRWLCSFICSYIYLTFTLFIIIHFMISILNSEGNTIIILYFYFCVWCPRLCNTKIVLHNQKDAIFRIFVTIFFLLFTINVSSKVIHRWASNY